MARILIVDDMEQNRYMLEALLSGHGHQVVSAADGREALKAAESDAFDLIVTDILMPVMDGFALCRQWKTDDNLKHIPFIFYTATYTEQKDIDFGLNLGADLYLVKPMDPVELMSSIERVLNGRNTATAREGDSPEESVYLQEYNQALIRKLEKKMLQLEAEVIERRNTEKQLLRLKTAIENTDESILLLDENGKIEYVNPAFERTVGHSREKTQGRSLDFLVSVDSNNVTFEDAWKAVKSGRTWRGRFSGETRTGRTIELEATISPIIIESYEKDGYVAVIRDVTQQMSMENQLIQSQKMEAIGALSSGIAHDFNNILGAIAGYTQLALYETNVEEKTKAYLNSVLEACARSKKLIEQILTFSRKSEREKSLIDLVPLIDESAKFLRASIPSTIEFRVDLESKAIYAQADPIQIQQVILNICTNAVYAMRNREGILSIKLKRIYLDEIACGFHPELMPGKHILLIIGDTGCGMSRETLSKIFEPFFTTKERGEGTGLGLSVAHGIIKGHKGNIVIYSEPGRGTTFNIYLPEAEGFIAVEEETDPRFLPAGTEHILYVDDERDIVNVGSEMLKKLGYRVSTALSGVEALGLFERDPESFDMVITDQTMPGMTGMELAGKILTIRPQLPLIICTGFSSHDSEDQAMAAGISRIINKPFDYRELALTVRKLIDEGSFS